ERARLAGHAGRSGEIGRLPRELHPVGREHLTALEKARNLLASEAELRCPCTPLLAQAIHRDAVVLAPARIERRDLRGPLGVFAALAHPLDDLRAALGEVLDDLS